MAFSFQGKDYGSKAEVVREMFDEGKVTLQSESKKACAKLLGMTVQTVHATLIKHTVGVVKVTKGSGISSKITPAVQQAVTAVKNRFKGKPIFIKDKPVEVQKELMADPHRIHVTWAPNQWGVPVPMDIIDPNYDPNWLPPPEDQIEAPWE